MKCPDCKGSGKYTSALFVEPCQKCKGRGQLNADGTPLNLPEWMDDYKDQIKFNPKVSSGWSDEKDGKDLTVEELGQLLKDSFTKSPELKVGDIIHVYENGWYKATVDSFGKGDQGQLTIYIILSFVRKMISGYVLDIVDLNYNLTQSRWEYIRAGTPYP